MHAFISCEGLKDWVTLLSRHQACRFRTLGSEFAHVSEVLGCRVEESKA